MYIMNMREPRTEPCGREQSRSTTEELLLSRTTVKGPVRQICAEPLEDDTADIKLMLKTKHQKVMVNDVECRRQIQQTHSRDLATIGRKEQVVADLQHSSVSTVELTVG